MCIQREREGEGDVFVVVFVSVCCTCVVLVTSINMSTYTHIYIYIYMCVCILYQTCIWLKIGLLDTKTVHGSGAGLLSLLLLTCTLLFSRKPRSPYPSAHHGIRRAVRPSIHPKHVGCATTECGVIHNGDSIGPRSHWLGGRYKGGQFYVRQGAKTLGI